MGAGQSRARALAAAQARGGRPVLSRFRPWRKASTRQAPTWRSAASQPGDRPPGPTTQAICGQAPVGWQESVAHTRRRLPRPLSRPRRSPRGSRDPRRPSPRGIPLVRCQSASRQPAAPMTDKGRADALMWFSLALAAVIDPPALVVGWRFSPRARLWPTSPPVENAK